MRRYSGSPAIVGLIIVGCSDTPVGEDSGVNCGPGTVLVGNVCVPDAATDPGSSSGAEITTSGSVSGGATDESTGADAETGAETTTTTSSSSSSAETTAAPVSCPGNPGEELDLQLTVLHDNPPNLPNWPVTTALTQVDFTNDGVHVVFDKLEGPERWPDIIPPDWEGPLQYTLGMALCIDGQWHASAAIQYWYGLEASGGNVALDDQVAVNWYYDSARWGEMAGHQPATGETIGLFVVAGNARAVHEDTPLQSPVMERSNVVLVPMPDVNGAMHSF